MMIIFYIQILKRKKRGFVYFEMAVIAKIYTSMVHNRIRTWAGRVGVFTGTQAAY